MSTKLNLTLNNENKTTLFTAKTSQCPHMYTLITFHMHRVQNCKRQVSKKMYNAIKCLINYFHPD